MKANKFISDKLAGSLVKEIEKAVPEIRDGVGRYKYLAKDMIRFQPIAEMCRHIREDNKIRIKGASKELGISQYKLKYIEEASVHNISHNHLERYVDYLGFRAYFDSWKRCSKDVYDRLSSKN